MEHENEEPKKKADDDDSGFLKPLLIGVGITLVGGVILDAWRRSRDRAQGIVGYAPIRSMPPGNANPWDALE